MKLSVRLEKGTTVNASLAASFTHNLQRWQEALSQEKVQSRQAARLAQPQVAAIEQELVAKNGELVTLVSKYQLLASKEGRHSPAAWQVFREIYLVGYTLTLALAEAEPDVQRFSGLAQCLAKRSLLFLRERITYLYTDKILTSFAGLVKDCFNCEYANYRVADLTGWGGVYPATPAFNSPAQARFYWDSLTIEELRLYEERQHALHLESSRDRWAELVNEARQAQANDPANLPEAVEALVSHVLYSTHAPRPSGVFTSSTDTVGEPDERQLQPPLHLKYPAESVAVPVNTEFELETGVLARLSTPEFILSYQASRLNPTARLELNLIIQLGFATLSAEQRAALSDWVCGYSPKEIAQRHAWSASLTRRYLVKGWLYLKAMLELEADLLVVALTWGKQNQTKKRSPSPVNVNKAVGSP